MNKAYKLHPKFKNIKQLKEAFDEKSIKDNQFTQWKVKHRMIAHELLNSKRRVFGSGNDWCRYKDTYWHVSLFVPEDEYETFLNKYMYLKNMEKQSNE